MARRSLRAAHWNEAKHPRDDRGRFAHKGGGKWIAKVARQMQAQFGDISMGAHPDHQPQGRLQTGKGHVIDTRAIARTAPLGVHGPAEAPGGRVGRTAAGVVSSAGAPKVASLKPGDHARVSGVDQYGQSMSLNGHVSGVSPVRMGRRGSKRKEDMLAVSMSETPSGANGWRGTVYVKPDATAEHTTPKPETTATGAVVGNTGLDTPRVGRQAGGVTAPDTRRAGTDAEGKPPTPEVLASRLRRHGLEKIAKDVEAGRYRKAENALHRETTSGRLARATFEKRNDARAIYNDLTRMPEKKDGEDLDGMTVVKSGSGWAVRGNEADRQATSGYLYSTKTKADALDWARTTAAARRAMRAGNYGEAERLDRERRAALVGGEGRAYRPQGSVAMVPAAAAQERAAALTAPSRTNTGPAADNAHGGNVEAAPAGREFNMRELKQILAGDSGFAHRAVRPTDEHRRLLEEAGATPTQSEAIMKKLGANTEQGHLTADVSSALHFGAMREAEEEAAAARSAKLLEATPRAYAGLLGDGPGAITHPKSRQVIEAMQANGWVIKDVQAGGISTWGPPGDDSKSITMISGKDRPSFYNRDQKLSGVKAIEHVGGPAPAKPSSKYGKLSDERVRQGLEMRGSTDAELVAEAKRRGIPINTPASSGIFDEPVRADALARETAPRVGDRLAAVREQGGRFSGNPNMILPKYERLTDAEWASLTPEERDNARFVMAKLAKREDVGDRARALQNRFGVWGQSAPAPRTGRIPAGVVTPEPLKGSRITKVETIPEGEGGGTRITGTFPNGGERTVRTFSPDTRPVGRTPAGRVGGVRQTQSVADAAEALQSVGTREAAHAALEGMTVDELKQVAKRLNRTTAGLTRKDQIRERLVESTVGSRLNSDVLRRNAMGPRLGGRSEGVGEPGSGFVEPPRVGRTPAERAAALRDRTEFGPTYNRGVADALAAYDRTGDENFVLEAEAAANLPGARERLTAERNAAALKNAPPPIDYNATATSYKSAVASGPRPRTGGDLPRVGRTASGERVTAPRPNLRTNQFGFPQTEGPARPPQSLEDRRAASLAARDGIPPKDGRPDITALATSNSKNDYHRWQLSTSDGRDTTMAPDVARVSGGVLDNKRVSAVVMNPKDGTGDYRYRIIEEGTGNVLEEGSGRDAGEVFRKADRIFSSQRGGGIARTEGNGVHYEVRSKQRPKDISRGDFGSGPFYDFSVVEVDKNGTEREVVKTNSMDRAQQHAAAMNAKEAGATERAAAALQASRSTSMADIYNRHRNLTREQFDALPADEQQRVLADLRKVRDSKEQVGSTIPSNRTSMGTTIRGTKDAPHVEGAQAKLRELTYTAPPPVDNSIEGLAARLKAGQLGSFYGTGLTRDKLNAISMAAGYGGIPGSWKLSKVHDYLRARVAAGDEYTGSGGLAGALGRAKDAKQARAMIEASELSNGITMAEMKTLATRFGGSKLTGDKRQHMADLAALVAAANGPGGSHGRNSERHVGVPVHPTPPTRTNQEAIPGKGDAGGSSGADARLALRAAQQSYLKADASGDRQDWEDHEAYVQQYAWAAGIDLDQAYQDVLHGPVVPEVDTARVTRDTGGMADARTAATARVDAQEIAFLRGLDEPFLADMVSNARFKRYLESGQIRPTGKTYKGKPLYEAVPEDKITPQVSRDIFHRPTTVPPGVKVPDNPLLEERAKKAAAQAGTIPKVTGYAKGRELEPGMLVNAADLLPMHESQGNTTGENPNPLGHANWVRVGLVGNTNSPAYQSYNSNRSLTGGMYVVFDQSGHPVGRMSANTIAEVNTEDVRPEAALQQLRTPIKVKVKVRNPITGEQSIEERDQFGMALVPSRFAREEAGMPAPKMLSDGIVDPADPHYGPKGNRPLPTKQPHGGFKQGNRTREQYKADRAKRDQAYAASEPERAARRAELEAQRKAEAAAQREQEREAAEKAYTVRREQDRRDRLTRQHASILEDLADPNPVIYDRKLNTTRPANSPEEYAAYQLDRGSDLTALARAYGVKTRGVDRHDLAPHIVAAVKAGKTPDLEVDAPKVLTGAAAAEAEAKKIATMDKRRRTAITKAIAELKVELARDDKFPMALEYASDNLLRQIAEAFGLADSGLTGRALQRMIKQLVGEGREPDLDAYPVTSLKGKRGKA